MPRAATAVEITLEDVSSPVTQVPTIPVAAAMLPTAMAPTLAPHAIALVEPATLPELRPPIAATTPPATPSHSHTPKLPE